jgi:DNA polymerase-4
MADIVETQHISGKIMGKRPENFIHSDMDAFYPSVEVLDNPALKGQPVIVGGSKKRGVVSSASYEARKYGVHSAQPMATAMRLCPEGVFLPVRMSRYRKMSQKVFKIFRLFTPLVEPVSIDEAFLDVTDSTRLWGQPEGIAGKIKDMVRNETGLTVSAGLAPSKFVAKIASDIDKPDGLTIVPPGRVREFLEPLSISKMWGVGKKTQHRLHGLGIRTIGDLSRFPADVLDKNLGKHGIRMHQLARGIDERDVIPATDAKSIGHERTFSQDILEVDSARKELLALANQVARRMRRQGVTGKIITLKVKYHDFTQVTRSATLPECTDDEPRIYATACELLDKTDAGTRLIRLLGVSVSQLKRSGSEEQLFLFHKDKASEKRKELNTALDALTERFGEDSIGPATLLTKLR